MLHERTAPLALSHSPSLHVPDDCNMQCALQGCNALPSIVHLLMSFIRRPAMHRALAVPDIVQHIVELIAAESSGKTEYEDLFDDPTCRTLYRLATVSRVFSEPALDLLWKRTTPWRLAVLMPPHMIRIDVTGDFDKERTLRNARNTHRLRARPILEKCYFLVSLVIRIVAARERYLIDCQQRFASDDAQLEDMTTLALKRFFFYSRRVRHLARSVDHHRYEPPGWWHLSQRTVDHAVVLAWQQASAVLFPALYHLHIQIPGNEDRSILHFMSPSITSLFVEAHRTESLKSFELPQDLAQRTKGLVHFTSKSYHLDVIQAVATSVLLHAPNLETVVAAGILTPDLIIHFASSERLRKLCARGNLDGHHHELAQGCFQYVEVAALCDDGPQFDFARWFLTSASTTKVRDLAIELSPPTKIDILQCTGIVRSMAHFTALVRVAFTCERMSNTGSSKEEQIQAARGVLEPLSLMHQLEEIKIHTNCAMALPELDCAALFACWPHLRVCDVRALIVEEDRGISRIKGLRLSLSALLEILIMCPHLAEFMVQIDCSTLPSEESITRLEQIDHPFYDFAGWLRCDIAASASRAAVKTVLQRALPHLKIERVLFQCRESDM
jgi:hypothetical protein